MLMIEARGIPIPAADRELDSVSASRRTPSERWKRDIGFHESQNHSRSANRERGIRFANVVQHHGTKGDIILFVFFFEQSTH